MEAGEDSKAIEKELDYSIYETTKSICPECKELIDADIIIRGGKVFMRKSCQLHGLFEALISSDADMYQNSFKYDKPGTTPKFYASKVEEGCPYDCGICPDHKQHTCLGIIEVLDECNLHCPTCFADAAGSYTLELKEIKKMIDLFVKCEGNPEVLQISGGEPTLHPDLNSIVKYAQSKEIRYVEVNTNGIKLADEEYAKKLAEAKPYIYLQFDGFLPKTYEKIRGRDLSKIKLKAIENCKKFDMPVTLVPTIQKGINDHEIGAIVEFAINERIIKAINFQPVAATGRSNGIDPLDRTTLPDIITGIEEQTNGLLKKSDFIPIPCPHPTCSMITYVHIEDGNVTPITRIVDVDDYLDYFKNRTLVDPDEIVRSALEGLWSASTVGGSDKTLKNYCQACGLSLPNLDEIKENILIIGSMAFMDKYTFDLKRARKCCVHEILPNGKMIPFCVYNTLYRKRLTPDFGGCCE
ncbi:MAG: radical SAM protein [Candidatus Hydrothermarchaeales archaeon]